LSEYYFDGSGSLSSTPVYPEATCDGFVMNFDVAARTQATNRTCLVTTSPATGTHVLVVAIAVGFSEQS